MNSNKRPVVDLSTPKVVGFATRPEDLDHLIEAETHPHLPFDIAEIRLDAIDLQKHMKKVTWFLENCKRWPVILTARIEFEGGQTFITPQDRTSMMLRLMKFPCVWAIDGEVEYRRDIERAIKAAKASKIMVIGSSHYISGTPDIHEAEKRKVSAFADMSADIFKMAALTMDAVDFVVLLQLLEREKTHQTSPRYLSVMPLGEMSRGARPFLASRGSVLNYGYAGDRPFDKNQWSAVSLRKFITRAMTEEFVRPKKVKPLKKP